MLHGLAQNMLNFFVKNIVFICENKIDAWLSERQISKYMNCSDKFASKCSVLVTRSSIQWTQYADVKMCRSNVYVFLNNEIDNFKAEEKFAVEQFAIFLEDKGISINEVIKRNLSSAIGIALNSKTILVLFLLRGLIFDVERNSVCI